jgi:hypothetical protein
VHTTAFRLRVVLALVALLGVLARWALGAHYHFQSGGWPEVWEQEFYLFKGTKCLSCSVVLYIVGWSYYSAPYVVTAIGGLFLKSTASISTLIILTFGLIGLDVGWYATDNRKDWYLALAPLLLTPVAGGCCLLAWLMGKAVTAQR